MRTVIFLVIFISLIFAATEMFRVDLSTTNLLLLVIATTCQTWIVEGEFKKEKK